MPQSLAEIYIHIVFSTKCRKRYLSNITIRNKLYAYTAAILKNHNTYLSTIGGTSDHVHILCTIPRDRDLSSIIKEAKRSSCIWLKQQDEQFRFFAWQAGFAAFSVSYSNVSIVSKYIQNQHQHHKQLSFEDELRTLLQHHEITFNEEYLWD